MLKLINIEKFCTPAKIYFTIAILSILIALFSGFNFMAVLCKLVFAVIYTFVLSWLCKKGWNSLSWFLVLLPYFLILLTFFGLIDSQIKEGLPDSISEYVKQKVDAFISSLYNSGFGMIPIEQAKSLEKEFIKSMRTEIGKKVIESENEYMTEQIKKIKEQPGLSENDRKIEIQKVNKTYEDKIKTKMKTYMGQLTSSLSFKMKMYASDVVAEEKYEKARNEYYGY